MSTILHQLSIKIYSIGKQCLFSGVCVAFLLFGTACNLSTTEPTATSSPTNTTTALPTSTITPSPMDTPTPSPTPTATHSATPTATFTATDTPTITPTASITPYPAVGFSFDKWEVLELPDSIRSGIDTSLIVFTNSNDQATITNIATAQPENTIKTLYFASPSNPSNRTAIIEFDALTTQEIYISARGNGIAYFRSDSTNSGIYVINLENQLSGRMVAINSLNQRGIISEPIWSPNGNEFAIALPTDYAMDIFVYQRDGSGRQNITQSGSYDFYPVWSPNGQYLAFVSDRVTCPSWIPGTENSCDASTTPSPTGGYVHVLNLNTRNITLVAEALVTEPPIWVNDRLVAFAEGDQTDLLNPKRTLWLADILTGNARQIQIEGENEADALYLSDAWSPDGSKVLVQRAGQQTGLILMQTDGTIIRQRDDFSFPRFGMSATWSNDSQRIGIGGVNGQCPYGVRVVDADFSFVATGNPPPAMCNPMYSANGNSLAFIGVNPAVDGRVDIYASNSNGFGAVNLTPDLRGEKELLGWVNP